MAEQDNQGRIKMKSSDDKITGPRCKTSAGRENNSVRVGSIRATVRVAGGLCIAKLSVASQVWWKAGKRVGGREALPRLNIFY